MSGFLILFAIVAIITIVTGVIVIIADKYTGCLDKYGFYVKKYLFLSSIMGIAYYITVKYNNSDWDLWARLAVGKIFSQIGNVLPHDIFAYTQIKQFWVDHEWGAGAVFYYLGHNFGDTGLLTLKFLILFAIAMFVFATNQNRRDGSEKPYRLSYYILLFWAICPAFDNVIRSHVFTYFFFAFWIFALDKVRQGQNKYVWILPVTMLIWANMHGGFLAGLGIVALFALGELINRRSPLKYLIILATSGLATLINPYGFKYWSYLLSAVTMDRPFVNEWAPLNFFGSVSQVIGFKIFVALTLLSLIYMLIKRFKEINWAEILILVVTFYMGMKHIRHVIFFAIAAASYIYYWLYPAINWYTFNVVGKLYSLFPPLLRKIGKLHREIFVYTIIFIFSLVSLVSLPRSVAVRDGMFPTKAVKFIQINHLSGNLLVLFNWGSYALWKLYPQCRVAVDGRYEEVYTDALIGDIARFHYVGASWDGLLRNYHTDLMLIPTEYDDLTRNLLMLDDWKVVYKDKLAMVFVPKSKSKRHWKMPPAKFDAAAEKYMSDIKVTSDMMKIK